MRLVQYQVDAFASKPFTGNPAVVCPLEFWLSDDLMQAIAQENNQAETAFFVREQRGYHIRWFTPEDEVDLCGHATLASAFVLFQQLGFAGPTIEFNSRSGPLTVSQSEEGLVLNFPSQVPRSCAEPPGLSDALDIDVERCLYNEDYIVVLDDEHELIALRPNFDTLRDIKTRGVIVTSLSDQCDFVCRFFGPRVGVNEDAVTGSAFTKLIPFWAAELGKQRMFARQVSARGGDVHCLNRGERVEIAGQARLFSRSEIYLTN